jgi:hypothetical protein
MITRGRIAPVLIAFVLLAASACSRSETDDNASPSPSLASPSSASTDAASPAESPSKAPKSPKPSADASPEKVATARTTFTANNVTLWNSEEKDLGFRVIFDSEDPTVSVRLRGVPSDNKVVSVCPIRGLTKVSPGNTCVQPSNTERVDIRHATRFDGVEVLLLGTAPNGGERLNLGQIQVMYNGPATGAETTVKTPPILKPPNGKPCKNNTCNPTFQVSPANTGRLRATTSFLGEGRAQLALESGEATVDSRQGAGDLRVSGRITANGSPLVALRNTGSRTLGVAVTEITWP